MKKSILGLAFASLVSATQAMSADYDVTITNVTSGSIFTPIYVISHKPGIKLFELGHPASSELAAIAEGGDFSSLATSLQGDSRVVDTADSAALLPDSGGLLKGFCTPGFMRNYFKSCEQGPCYKGRQGGGKNQGAHCIDQIFFDDSPADGIGSN